MSAYADMSDNELDVYADNLWNARSTLSDIGTSILQDVLDEQSRRYI